MRFYFIYLSHLPLLENSKIRANATFNAYTSIIAASSVDLLPWGLFHKLHFDYITVHRVGNMLVVTKKNV